MAANSGSDSTGRKNYYNISYGMLGTKLKEAPEGYSEIKEAELKSKIEKVEAIDLRKKYIDKGGDYPYMCFFPSITGVIQDVEKDEYDKGISLKVTILDIDGDESVLQTKFYGKTSSNLLNRLLNISNIESSLTFTPYSMPSESEIGGKKIKFYNQGVSVKEDANKIDMAFKKDSGLPDSEQVINQEGKPVTSRVKQINFLWEKVQAKFAGNTASEAPKEASAPKDNVTSTKKGAAPVTNDELPF